MNNETKNIDNYKISTSINYIQNELDKCKIEYNIINLDRTIMLLWLNKYENIFSSRIEFVKYILKLLLNDKILCQRILRDYCSQNGNNIAKLYKRLDRLIRHDFNNYTNNK